MRAHATSLVLAAALAWGCSAPPAGSAEPHAHAQPHACAPVDVPADPADALTHTPHTAGRPQVRYYVVNDA